MPRSPKLIVLPPEQGRAGRTPHALVALIVLTLLAATPLRAATGAPEEPELGIHPQRFLRADVRVDAGDSAVLRCLAGEADRGRFMTFTGVPGESLTSAMSIEDGEWAGVRVESVGTSRRITSVPSINTRSGGYGGMDSLTADGPGSARFAVAIWGLTMFCDVHVRGRVVALRNAPVESASALRLWEFTEGVAVHAAKPAVANEVSIRQRIGGSLVAILGPLPSLRDDDNLEFVSPSGASSKGTTFLGALSEETGEWRFVIHDAQVLDRASRPVLWVLDL